MTEAFREALALLATMGPTAFVTFFWFTLVFEAPRYFAPFMLVAALGPLRREGDGPAFEGRVTVVVAGHNEADSIERCVRSLHEQSRPPDEIIAVSDGSTDGMAEKLRDLRARGLIDKAHSTDLRAGKSAAINLGERWATGDVVVVIDCDCTYERHAFKRLIAPFADPSVGAVSGNVVVRNPTEGFVTRFQAIEYLICISLGRRAQDMLDQVTCVSGAFGAFRRRALAGVDGIDVGGGEDFDLTLKLRKAGWRIVFAEDSVCFTDVPATLRALIKQRFRWERDSVRLRYRKHGDLMRPFASGFTLKEAAHEVDFLVFNVLAAAIMPFYVLWLWLQYGDFAWTILLAMQIALTALDVAALLAAALATPSARLGPLLPALPLYGLFMGVVMRNVRLFAYVQEWLFNASAEDSYVPSKVRRVRSW